MHKQAAVAVGIIVIGALATLLFFRGEPTEKNNAPPAAFEEQAVSGGGVNVSVTPRGITAEVATWEFEVTLDTHSVELSEDMAASATLLDEMGNAYRALTWEGDLPGGHHRSGVLKFAPIAPLPRTITLVLADIGGVAERKFSWELQ